MSCRCASIDDDNMNCFGRLKDVMLVSGMGTGTRVDGMIRSTGWPDGGGKVGTSAFVFKESAFALAVGIAGCGLVPV